MFLRSGVSMMQLEAPLRLCHNCLWYYKFSQRLLSLSAPHRSFASYYDVLGVKPDASLEQIKNAFFDKSKKLHPDSDPSNPSLHTQFVKLNEAYRVLSKEHTRKEYDLRLRYHGVDLSFRPSSRYTHHPGSAETNENVRYWEQFHTVHEHSGEGWQKKRKKNFRLVGYCVTAMLLSVCAHYVGFSHNNCFGIVVDRPYNRKLEEVHNDFMNKKDSVINKLYNESKERARVNGFKKQQEILRQKHAEFMERYKINQSGKEK